MSAPPPTVGIGLFCFRPNGTFMIGKRKGAIGSGTFALPGGHLEYGESFAGCAARELLEETGLVVDERDVVLLTVGNNVFKKEGRHYVTLAMGCYVGQDVEPEVLEPDKCEGWEWVGWERVLEWAGEDLRSGEGEEKKLFQPMVEFVTQNERGFDPFAVLKEKTLRNS